MLCLLRFDLNLCFLRLFSILCLLVLCHLGIDPILQLGQKAAFIVVQNDNRGSIATFSDTI